MIEIRWLRSKFGVVWHAYPLQELNDLDVSPVRALCGHTATRAELVQEPPTAVWLVCIADITHLDPVRRPGR